MTTVLLDTHALHWWSAEPDRLSSSATRAVTGADRLAVAAITWLELAWHAAHERIVVSVPIRSWLDELAAEVETIGITPAVADTAMSLPSSFPRDLADQLIYATAVVSVCRLVTKDPDILQRAI